jgi:hypothetical protein
MANGSQHAGQSNAGTKSDNQEKKSDKASPKK